MSNTIGNSGSVAESEFGPNDETSLALGVLNDGVRAVTDFIADSPALRTANSLIGGPAGLAFDSLGLAAAATRGTRADVIRETEDLVGGLLASSAGSAIGFGVAFAFGGPLGIAAAGAGLAAGYFYGGGVADGIRRSGVTGLIEGGISGVGSVGSPPAPEARWSIEVVSLTTGQRSSGFLDAQYSVRSGDTLSAISQRTGISVENLLASNPQISNPDRIVAGDSINVPGSGGSSGSAAGFNGGYTVQSGDTLSGIAQRTGTSVDSLLGANPQISNPDRINAGDTISVPGSGGSGFSGGGQSSSSGGGSYSVERGDTLSGIAAANNTTVGSLLDANPGISNPDRINAGDTINVPDSSSSRSSSSSSSSNAGGKPVILDLDGDGIEITPVGSSNMFFDMSGDGLADRTAWAGVGDGVLVRDAGNDGIIDQAHEVNFTRWDSTARTDMEALRNAFDTNRDGVLSAGDRDFELFKVLVTNADGSTTLKTLVELDIVSIGLTTNNQRVVMSDGSEITGTSEFTRSDGTTGTAADTRLTYDPSGYIVDRTLTGNPDGTTTLVTQAFRIDGTLANITRSTVGADGSVTTLFDNNGDGIDDRMQTIGSTGSTFFEPTVVSGATQDILVAREGTFAPLAPIIAFEDEVLAMANASEFGLASYARDVSRIFKVAEGLESGMVGVNTAALADGKAPSGSVKQSGLGGKAQSPALRVWRSSTSRWQGSSIRLDDRSTAEWQLSSSSGRKAAGPLSAHRGLPTGLFERRHTSPAYDAVASVTIQKTPCGSDL